MTNADSVQFRYRGTVRSGTAEGGAFTLAPAELPAWVERHFRQGWKRLTVFRGDIEVGGIGLHPDTDKRTWWAES